MPQTTLQSKPWYREPWPWFLISLPATAVVAGLATVWIAVTSADGLVVGDYYKAGLAINQTLARDELARSLALAATLKAIDGGMALGLSGRLATYPAQLTLTLAHPTRAGMDHTLVFQHAGAGQYRAGPSTLAVGSSALPAGSSALPAGKWQVELSDADAAAWRLAGVLHTPLREPVRLAADTVSAIPTKGD